jgi:hypothetical protein
VMVHDRALCWDAEPDTARHGGQVEEGS